jgi:hypothetical protein
MLIRKALLASLITLSVLTYSSIATVVGAAVGPERPLAERTEIARPHELPCVRLGGDVRAQYAHDPAIDGEHGPFGLDQLEDLCRTAERHNLTPIARVPDIGSSTILRYLETMQEITRRIRQAGRTMQSDVMQGAWVSDMLLDAGRRILSP